MSQPLTSPASEHNCLERDAQRTADLRELLARNVPSKTVYFDSETTGLRSDDGEELVEISLVDDAGNVLLDTLLKPRQRTAWPEAQAVHGIRPADVQNAPSLESVLPRLEEIIENAGAVVIYNAPFDLSFLPEPIRSAASSKSICAMRAYSLHVGEWSESRQNFRWFKLGAAAEAAGHVWEGTAHRAYADAMAVRRVWQWLCREAVAAS